MTRRRRARWLLSTLAVQAALASGASAQDAAADAEKVRVEFLAPESCAGRERFFAELRTRLGTDWEAEPGELARSIRVSVSSAGDRYIARIELTDSRGRAVARAVSGTGCEQVIEGIALITVLAIQAQLDELLSRSEATDVDAPFASKSREIPDRTGSPPSNEGSDVASKASPAPAGPSRPSVEVRIGARATLLHGAGPKLSTLYGGFAALAWERWVLGLAVDVGGTGRVRAQGVPAEFELLAARAEGCARFRPAKQPLALEPCVFAQIGSLAGEAAPSLPQVARGRRGSAVWFVPGLLLAARAELGPVLLGLEASAGVSLNREQFYVDGGGSLQVVYQVPRLTAGGALTAGVAL